MTSIAVLLICYNRKATTLCCLGSLAAAALSPGVSLAVYLVDDASTDGTGEAVAKEFPCVRLLKGTGSLYWGGGMRHAFGMALKDGHDFYLWLNDDVGLYPGALTTLVETYRRIVARNSEPAIIVGACCDPEMGRMVYSGQKRATWHPLNFEKIEPDARAPIACETMNGNVVLISAAVAARIGNIDRRFIHQMGDLDYGLRARRCGIPIWIAPGYVASCKPNPHAPKWKSASLPFGERLKLVNAPLGLPLLPWLTFGWRHGGVLGLLMAFYGYREVFLPRRAG